jgi:hypothetical protein
VIGQKWCLPVSLFGTKCAPSLLVSPPRDPEQFAFNLQDGNDSILVDDSLRASGGSGGAGNDSLTILGDGLLWSSPGADVYVGSGAPAQWVDYRSDPAAVTVTLDGVADDGAPGEGDNVQPSIDDLGGTPFADTLIGSEGDNRFSAGGGGADHIEGRGGNDEMFALRGADLFGGDGNDRLTHGGVIAAGPPGGVSVGGEGDDTIATGRTDVPVDAGPGNDVIDLRFNVGPQASSTVTCGPGDDTVRADASDVIAADCEHVAIG